jgi:Cu+-exporting ATPase
VLAAVHMNHAPAHHVINPGRLARAVPLRFGDYLRPALHGATAAALLLALYLTALTLVSGWEFTAGEFGRYWYYVVALAAGFGVQVALFTRLRALAGGSADSGTVVAASGTTSTAAMVSCCAHYLVNVAPMLGATGLVAFAAQFQVELFWVGLAFSLAGIAFVLNRVLKAEQEHAECAT